MKSKSEPHCSSLNQWQNMKFVILPRCGKSMKMTRKEKKLKKISKQTYSYNTSKSVFGKRKKKVVSFNAK